MYYIRNYRDKLLESSRFFPVLVVSGARQSGKTTLIKQAFPDYNYVSLDLPSIAEQAEQSPDDFFSKYATPLIIDEVQYAPGIFRHIKRLVDKNRHKTGQFILTGSQKFNLMKEISDSLAGRSMIIDLENLSREEIAGGIRLENTTAETVRLICRGQFPELWRIPEFPSDSFYSSYMATYLERDVRQILNITSLRDFERFLRALAPRSGQLLNKTEIARDVGVSVKAINDWLSVLQASNQIVLLEPWFYNISKRLVKSPKVYFCDSGLLSWLLGVNADDFISSPFKGQIWKTFVFSELRKINYRVANPAVFWFYRDQLAREIDFVIERGGTLSFAECKWKQLPDKDDLKYITAVSSELQKKDSPYKPGRHWVICNTDNLRLLTGEVRAVGPDSLADLL